MAEEEREEAREEERPKRRLDMSSPIVKAVLFGIGVVALLIVIVLAVKIVGAVRPSPLPTERVEEVKKKKPLDVWAVTEEHLVARLADKEEPHLVRISEIHLAHDPKYKAVELEMAQRRYQILDIINGVFLSKTSSELDSMEDKRKVAQEIVEEINKILIKGQIEDVYMQIVVQ
jgi:flagellar basal body-associated protein FliL